MFLHKQHDYGPKYISVGTQLQTMKIKLSLMGLWFRMNDKLERLKTLLLSGNDGSLEDEGEPMEDSYLMYQIMDYGTIVGRGKWGK